MARQLSERGIEAAALEGGWEAWRAAYPVEPIAAALAPGGDGRAGLD